MKKHEKESTRPPATSTPKSDSVPSHRDVKTHSSTSSSSMGMKHSKSEHSGLGKKDKKDKKEIGDGASKGKDSPMGKKYISKSSENLSAQRKGRQLTTVTESTRPRSNNASAARAAAVEKNKENVSVREKNAGFAKPKPVKPHSATSASSGGIRKASSTQSIDKGSVSSGSVKSSNSNPSKSSTSTAIKRAQSTQNICKDRFAKKRTSAPADVMAYNAELLANFEKEKKFLELRISEITKVAESRKGEIEKYKYEVKHLKEQVSQHTHEKEDLELLRHQNKQLSDRLHELGFPVEQSTDSEKLLLKASKGNQKSSSPSISQVTNSVSSDSLSSAANKPQPINHQSNPSAPSASSNSIQSPQLNESSSISIPGASDEKDKAPTSLIISDVDSSEFRQSASISASEPGTSLPDLCGTPDHPSILSLEGSNWEKQSNKSACSDGALSEASVACLTERILQMEETNYSTTEELQATLQELTDLQDSVNDLSDENGRLETEKAVLLESLCTQTQKLENTRIQLEHLKCLLISGELPPKSGTRDDHLLGLLKSAQEEREELLRKQTEWSNAMQALETECKGAHEAGQALREKYSLLKDSNKSLLADKNELEPQLQEAKGLLEAERIEVNRLKTLLDTERKKVDDLELARQAQDKTDVEALLDAARQDKARLEQKVADLTESLALGNCEQTRLKDCMASKEHDLIVARNNAKSQMEDLHFQLETREKDKHEVEMELKQLRDHVVTLEHTLENQEQENKTIESKLSGVEAELGSLMQQKQMTEDKMMEMTSKFDTESEEWKQFQKDLQMAVVIANNQTQELQEEKEVLQVEKLSLSEQVTSLTTERDKLKEDLASAKRRTEESPARAILTNAELKGKVYNSMDRELAKMREGRPHLDQRSQSISVKSLIRSIEETVKSGCSSIHSSGRESRRSSTSSDISINIKELVKSPQSPLLTPDSPMSPSKDISLRTASLRGRSGSDISPCLTPVSQKLDMRCDDTPAKGTPLGILKDRTTPRRNSGAVEPDLNKKYTPKDPLASLAKVNKGSKRNALLKWCQLKTVNYSHVDITNFSSSWNDGLGFCALLHSYLPDKIPYVELDSEDKRKNFSLAFEAGESVGVKSNLNINDMVSMERPDWQAVMTYVTTIYKHFEGDKL